MNSRCSFSASCKTMNGLANSKVDEGTASTIQTRRNSKQYHYHHR
jgi:hypothetical protein